MINKFVLRVIFVFFSACFIVLFGFADQKIDELYSHIEESIKRKDIAAYLQVFSPSAREEEESYFFRLINGFEIEDVAVYKTGRTVEANGLTRTCIRVLLEGLHRVRIEVWCLDLQSTGERLQVVEKRVTSNLKNLYKLKIPSGREKRARFVKINQADIEITFKDAVVFYDNLPGTETALLVMGEGELLFSPSLPREKHQLELVFKKRRLKDKLKYVYLRFSQTFFERNIFIEENQQSDNPVTQIERNKAYALFTRHYSRSFTVENSLTGKLLSFLPRSDETVLEFEGQKIGMFTYIYSPFSEEEVTLFEWEKKRFLNHYSPVTEEGERKFFVSFGEKFDVKKYDITVDFNPDNYYISGKARINIESKFASLNEVKFKLNPELEILRINDEHGNVLFFSKDKLRSSLYVYFLEPVPQDKTVSIEIYYRGKIEPPKVIDDVISGFQYEFTAAQEPLRYMTYLYSLSSYWYPHPPEGDYFTARAKIIIPSEYAVVSNGKLIEVSSPREEEGAEKQQGAGGKAYEFESSKPLKYLSFIVGRFEKEEEAKDPFPIHYMRTPETITPRWGLFDEARNILRFYGQRFGAFPFEKLSIVHRVWTESGGHSPASFIVLNQLPRVRDGMRVVSSESPVNLSRWNEYFLAHEIAHQWWGQGVTWGSYHDLWISEGLAQFSSILYLREKYGEDAYANILKKISNWTEKKSEWGPIILGSRLSYFDFSAFQAIIYNKPALILNMLKDMLGEKVFFQGLKEFYLNYRYGTARTKDFINVLAGVSGQDLKPFFEEWFESYSLPHVYVKDSVEKNDTGYLLEIDVVQSGKVFVFPLWFEFHGNGKKVRKMVIVKNNRHKFVFPLDQKPKKIKINPDKAIPGKFH
jgi:hypothetical protein